MGVIAGLAVVGLLASACGSTPPTSPPEPASAATSPPPAASATGSLEANEWVRAPSVGQPDGFLVAGAVDCGCQKHPAIDSLTTGVTDGPAGLVAVGWILQDFSGSSWQSRDGLTWTFTGGFPARTLMSAVASNGQRYVAVGQDGAGATAWTSTTGSSWQRVVSPAFADSPLRLTAIAPWHGGFVSGGYRGSEFFSAEAELWLSADGLIWQPAALSSVFGNARISGVAANGSGLVAVGQAGPADAPGPAIVWTSPDGLTWTRVPDGPIFAGGRMRAIAFVPPIGFVAVGENLAGDTGIVWTSPDGRVWDRAPASPIFGRPGIQVRMYTVAVGPNGAVVGGTLDAGVQYGETAIWTSSDGEAWIRFPDDPEFLDSEVTASTGWNGRVVAVGDRGAPDAYQATAWLSSTGVGN